MQPVNINLCYFKLLSWNEWKFESAKVSRLQRYRDYKITAVVSVEFILYLILIYSNIEHVFQKSIIYSFKFILTLIFTSCQNISLTYTFNMSIIYYIYRVNNLEQGGKYWMGGGRLPLKCFYLLLLKQVLYPLDFFLNVSFIVQQYRTTTISSRINA